MRGPSVSLAVAAAVLAIAGCGGGDEHELPPPAARPTILQDDALLLHRSNDQLRATLRELRRIGVEWVRVTAGWSVIAPAADAQRPPAFDARDPDAYPLGAWDKLDRLVAMSREEGLRVLVDIAFWAPRWATRTPATPADRRFPYGLVALRAGPGRVRFWVEVRTASGPRRVRIETPAGSGWTPLASFGERTTSDEGLLEAVVAADPGAAFRVAVREGDRWVTGQPLLGAREGR